MREQVADVLVGDRAAGDRRVPHRNRRAQESAGVEIEVLLGVVGEDPRLGEQQRDVGDAGEESVLKDSRPKAGGSCSFEPRPG